MILWRVLNASACIPAGETADSFIVSGRGALHISILMENMRREGFEFAVGPPKVCDCFVQHMCVTLFCIALLCSVTCYRGLRLCLTMLAGTSCKELAVCVRY